MTGAAALCTEASLRAGCGIATLAVPESQQPILAVKLTEAMTVPVPEQEQGVLGGSEALKALAPLVEGYDAVLVGPGLGRAQVTGEFVKALVREADRPLILDADAIYALRGTPEILREAKHVPILTHLGDAGLGLWSQTCEDCRHRATLSTMPSSCSRARHACGLPGRPRLLHDEGQCRHGDGGAGDVLAGRLRAHAAGAREDGPVLGVYLHGLPATLPIRRRPRLLAGDILAKPPSALPPAGILFL